MSERHNHPLRHPDEPGGAGAPRRAASVTLQNTPMAVEREAVLDPGNQALADALRVMLRLLQLGVIVIAVLYVLSGFQSVREGQRGLRLLFGAVQTKDLEPGFQFSAPYPLGELVKVETGEVELKLDKQYWVYLADEAAMRTPVDQLPQTPQLNPEREGSLLTADGNIAHMRWQANYQRRQVVKFAQTINPDDEGPIVAGALQNAIVHAVAEATIRDVLYENASGIAVKARQRAQNTLDQLGSGIEITQLLITEKMPPTYVRTKFQGVQAAAQKAAEKRDDAEGERRRIQNEVAGAAFAALDEAIDQFELAQNQGDEAAKRVALERIDGILEGRVSGGAEAALGPISGEAAQMMAEASQYRSAVVSQTRSGLERFRAKSEQYRLNPRLMIATHWSDSVSKFYTRSTVETLLVPPGTDTMILALNRDPSVVEAIAREIRDRVGAQGRAERQEMQMREQYKMRRGLRMLPTD